MQQNVVCFSVLALHSLCLAAELGVGWSNLNYFYRDRIDTSRSLVSALERFDAQVAEIGGSGLSAYAAVDATNSADNRAALRQVELLQGYVSWSNATRAFFLKAGRQSRYDSPEPVFFDGVRVDATAASSLFLDLSVGVPVPSRYESNSVMSIGNSSPIPIVAGITVTPTASTSLRLGYLHQTGRAPGSLKRLTAIDAMLSPGNRWQTAGNLLLDDATIRNMCFTGQIVPVDFLKLYPSFITEYRLHDSTLVFERSINERHFDPSFAVEIELLDVLLLGAGYTGRILQSERMLHNMDGSVELPWFTMHYRHEWGDEGVAHHLEAGVDILRTPRFTAGATGMYAVWGDCTTAIPGRSALTGTLFSSAKPWAFLDIRFELQALRNELYDLDMRAVLGTRVHLSRFFP